MDLLLKKMHSSEDHANRTRPWIVRNKLVGLLEMSDKKKYPCVSIFATSIEEVPEACWKMLKVKGHRDVVLCSKTLTFLSAAKAEFHYDKSNTVVTHVFVDCIVDDMKPNDKVVFWKHQMELYFQLINSHYENVKEIDADIVEVISDELQKTNIIDKALSTEVHNPEEPTATEAQASSSDAHTGGDTA